MDFYTLLDQVIDLLRQRQRVSYRALKRQFQLDDDYLEDLKVELIRVQQLAVDHEGEMLIWTGGTSSAPTTASPAPPPATLDVARTQGEATPISPPTPDAERRQLTVLFCDLVDSTHLASQLDPEDWRDVVRAYQAMCTEVIQRFEGHVAQYLGDGVLVYFGYPQAHEDDAHRAVRTGLRIIETLVTLNTHLEQAKGIRLAVRLGIHTGSVVVGAVGTGARQEQLALGDTPNIAARLQGFAAPDTVVIGAATSRLIQGYFLVHDLGLQTFRGVATPLRVYRVLGESGAQSRLDIATTKGLTPLVGREQELGVLLDCWAQLDEGLGRVVVVSGEAGIGKSRLVQVLRDRLADTGHTRIECRCAPHAQHSAFYPIITHLERALALTRADAPDEKVRKLEGALAQHAFPLAEVVPLFTALLSLPLPPRYAPFNLTPQQQRQQTLEALLTWLLQETERQSVLFVMEDLHWVDPSTLEFLHRLVDQGATTRILVLLTCRPEFTTPWTGRAHLSQVTLTRLPRPQVEHLVTRVAGAKALPPEVVQQIVAKTDGVPLFVEELTKMVLESGLLQEREDRYELTGPLPTLAIPTTLQDSLMARLDRLSTVKAVAQLGATIGRQFAYELLRAVAPLDEAALQHGLRQLVEAELVYQRGMGSQALYMFKHALIQDAAYQSLLKSTRQQYHQRIAQVLEAQFGELIETQPELLAHHYTEAGLSERAVMYWHRAGQHAIERSAHVEAISHLRKGLEILQALPETLERARHELRLSITLGLPLIATKGYAAPEVGDVYTRARELCQQVGDVAELFPVLRGLWIFYVQQGKLQTACELGDQLLRQAQEQHDVGCMIEAHRALGSTLYFLGDFARAWAHQEQGGTLYDPQQHRALAFHYGQDPGVVCRAFAAVTLWSLGYPEAALRQSREALTLAQTLAHPFSFTYALFFTARLHQHRREAQATCERAEVLMTLAREHGFAQLLAMATMLRGWALTEQGQVAEGMGQTHQGLASYQSTAAEVSRPFFLGLLAAQYSRAGQAEEGLRILEEALAAVPIRGEHFYEAELYRLTGELALLSSADRQAQAEMCFQQALDMTRRQQAKSLELRVAMSLARLWQHQGKRAEAYVLLAPIYGWFTEGFSTADLQEAKALLEALT
jgi:class 3 adenylate cyclase/predicted ATPase